jgi:hypothetical protein
MKFKFILYLSVLFFFCTSCGGIDRVVGVRGHKGDQGSAGNFGAQGNKGDKGESGDKGDKGDLGSKGEKGDTGSRGEKGDDGDSCVVIDNGDDLVFECGNTTASIKKTITEIVVCACVNNKLVTTRALLEEINAGKYQVVNIGPCKKR